MERGGGKGKERKGKREIGNGGVTLALEKNSCWHPCFNLLSRVSILTRDIDIANLSTCLSVRNIPV